MVVAAMNDPFYGLVYARGFPQTCRSHSHGQRRVKLKVNVEDCGVKVVEDENESTHYEMMVYVQYDRHVQQAIDEQVLVRCNPDERIVVKASMSQPREDEPEVTERPRLLVKAARLADDVERLPGHAGRFAGLPAGGDTDGSPSAASGRRSNAVDDPSPTAERHTADADTVYSEGGVHGESATILGHKV
ncbi:hypothetical protein FJT64_018661 [Amphibalanus amphitrite]|uniref:ZP domain-containing protein n=1 Tax=Amphibalanus amphitrite TaxID=1232801 RepID=A0A6A4WU19_AMPAM|nr:hypothetical protein FJT64_018661 [Amphibalanus amphitrite]